MKDRIHARKMIEAGAEVIIGTHSHCIQAYEYYKEKLIIYGLGNFLFGGLKGREHILWPKMSRPTCVLSALVKNEESISIDLAKEISRKSPYTIKVAKKAVRYALEMPFSKGIESERDAFVSLFDTRDKEIGIKSYFERTNPEWIGE